MTSRSALSILLGGLAACTPPPQDTVAALSRALTAQDLPATMAVVHPDYADPRGDRARLEADLRDLFAASARAAVTFTDASVAEGLTANDVTVTGRLDAEWVGEPVWKVRGPAQLAMVRDDGWKVRGGLLPALRDVRALAAARRAALEANDAEAMRPLLHPSYRDGERDADETLARLAQDLDGIRIRLEPTHYRLELRGPTAHLDEHYVLTVGERRLPPAVARFTLAPTVGRWRLKAGLFRD